MWMIKDKFFTQKLGNSFQLFFEQKSSNSEKLTKEQLSTVSKQFTSLFECDLTFSRSNGKKILTKGQLL